MMIPSDFERLVPEYRPVVRSAILHFTKGWVRDTEDLEQAVWLRLVRALGSERARYDPARGALTTYIYWVARSVCINQFEKNSRTPSNLALRLEPIKPDTDTPMAISAARIPALRDDTTEDRLVLADTIRRLRTVAASMEDGAQLLARFCDVCEAMPGTATDRRVAVAMRVPIRTVQQVRERARALLAALGVA